MADIKLPKNLNLREHVRRTVSAHQAVIEGIATHAEKHRLESHAKREAMQRKESLGKELPRGKA